MKSTIYQYKKSSLKNRNTIFFLFFSLLATFTVAAETITLSGKITNTPDGKIKIWGESFDKEITLKADGSFSETFSIDYTGNYMLATKANRISLYLAKGTKLNITANDADFGKSLRYTGKGSAENQYIANKNIYVTALNQEELYKLDEAAFLSKTKEINTGLLGIYTAASFEDSKFKEKEARNINYFNQTFYVNYPQYHEHYAKIEGFKPTDAFPKLDPKINLDDNEEFLFSNAYKQLVNVKFNQAIESKITPEDQFMWKIAMPELKKIKSPSIRNSMAQLLGYEISSANPDSAELYKELMAISTNEIFKKDLTAKYDKIKTLVAGTPSPGFDYENHAGGKTSLESLKGKYVYIDVWATWCGPCRQEIPSLQKVEEEYKTKNISFVSLSIDTKKDYDKWKKMVTDQKLGGIQLIADNDWTSKFAVDYAIMSIPRFILIDPDGKIVNADAPRPSDPKLVSLFNDLKI